MGEWTPAHFTGIATAIALVIAAIFSERVVNAFKTYCEWRAERTDKRMAAQALERELDEKGHKIVIRRMDRQITSLEQRCFDLTNEHTECREMLATVNGQYSVLRERYDSVVLRLDNLERGRQC